MSGWQVRARLRAQAAVDGDGVAIQRIGGHPAHLDPFLLLDELRAEAVDDLGGGFPAHPHRGFETITLARAGGFRHRDSQGNEGAVGDGGAQWMTAGRGVVHEELPLPGQTRFHGFQLWLNLPATDKLVAPDWRDLPAAEIPEHRGAGWQARVVVGSPQLDGALLTGPGGPEHVQRRTRPLVVELTSTAPVRPDLVPGVPRVLAYLWAGQAQLAGQALAAGELLVLDAVDAQGRQTLPLELAADTGLLLLGGVPLGEPVVQYGPFVMNDRAGIEQALADFRDGRLALSS